MLKRFGGGGEGCGGRNVFSPFEYKGVVVEFSWSLPSRIACPVDMAEKLQIEFCSKVVNLDCSSGQEAKQQFASLQLSPGICN